MLHTSNSCDVSMCHVTDECATSTMGWLRLVGSLKLQVSFAKEPYKRDYVLQKRPIILRRLLIVATPYACVMSLIKIRQITHECVLSPDKRVRGQNQFGMFVRLTLAVLPPPPPAGRRLILQHPA